MSMPRERSAVQRFIDEQLDLAYWKRHHLHYGAAFLELDEATIVRCLEAIDEHLWAAECAELVVPQLWEMEL